MPILAFDGGGARDPVLTTVDSEGCEKVAWSLESAFEMCHVVGWLLLGVVLAAILSA